MNVRSEIVSMVKLDGILKILRGAVFSNFSGAANITSQQAAILVSVENLFAYYKEFLQSDFNSLTFFSHVATD